MAELNLSPNSHSEGQPSARVLATLRQQRSTPRQKGVRGIALLVGLAILILSFRQSEINFAELFGGSRNMSDYIASYFPPDFTDWEYYLEETLITISMAIWGTLLAVIAGVPLALLASDNICPFWIVQPVRRLLDAMRAINELVFALIFIVAVGFGPFAGVMALFIHTAGTLGKLFSEAVEAIDPGPVEGIRATGASPYQEVLFGVIPQVLPLWVSFTLYRFESNVRSASVIGLIGAGGIGFALSQSFRTFEYQKVCAILIILIVAVGIIDYTTAKLRNWLV